jgi:hypothetical protein
MAQRITPRATKTTSSSRRLPQKSRFNPLWKWYKQLAAQRSKARSHNIGHAFVARIGDDTQQFLNAFASDRCDDAKLGKVRADRIDH